MSHANSLHRKLLQAFGMLLGITIAVYLLRGLGILTFIPGGVILLLFLAAIATFVLSYIQKIWWRF